MYNHQLDAFICAAEEGSFRKAAEKMFITTSALVQQVNLLEKSLGGELLNRNSRGVSLTPAGLRAYENAKKIIEISNETKELIKSIEEGPKEKIRVLRTPTARYRYLAKYIRMMEREDPSIEVEYLGVSSSGRTNINISDLVDCSEGVNLDLSLNGICEFVKLLDSPLCIALPEGHKLFGQRLIDPSELKGSSVFMIAPGRSTHYDRLREILVKEDVHIIDVAGLYSEDTFNICRTMNYGLISPAIWQDIHPDIEAHILTTTITIPYGVAFYLPIKPAARRLMNIMEQDGEKSIL